MKAVFADFVATASRYETRNIRRCRALFIEKMLSL